MYIFTITLVSAEKNLPTTTDFSFNFPKAPFPPLDPKKLKFTATLLVRRFLKIIFTVFVRSFPPKLAQWAA